MSMLKVIASTSAVAGVSFLLGKYYDDLNSNRKPVPVVIKKQDIVNVPRPSVPIAVNKDNAQIFLKYGNPSATSNIQVYEGFALSYDTRFKTANWVIEHITPQSMKRCNDYDRKKCEFHTDDRIHRYFRSQNSDYWGSGFDRGHLAAAGNHRSSQKRVDETFVLTNMSPQVGKGFNRDKWNELEMHCRRKAKKAVQTYVATGPLYLSRKFEDGKKYIKFQVIGDNEVAVPTHFFKVALYEYAGGNFELESFILPNEVIDDKIELSTFYVPKNAVERSAGILIFDKVPQSNIKKINDAEELKKKKSLPLF